MMLYSRINASSVGHEGVTYRPGADGGFDFPDPVSDYLIGFHDGASGPMWETAAGRQQRLIAEEMARRADPATLLAAFEQLAHAGVPGVVPPDA